MQTIKSIKFLAGAIITGALATGMAFAKEQTFVVDPAKSRIQWTGSKVIGNSKHVGTIKLDAGTIVLKDGEPKGGSFKVDMTTIVDEDLKDEKWNTKLVNHLNSDDFFSTHKFKTSTFVVKSVKKLRDKVYEISGDLTIKGITKPISFEANVVRRDRSLTAKGTINFDRTLYDVRYGSGKFFENLGDKMISDTIELEVNLVAALKNEKPRS